VREVLPKGGVGAELGVQHGHFTRQLLDLTRPVRLHLVDPWYLLGKEWYWEEGRRRSTMAGLKGVLDEFEDELVRGQAVLEIGDDLEVLAACPDHYFDWVYIDSSHDYEHTTRELDLLGAKMKPGGMIAGDDWIEDPDHTHHGVCRAVKELLASGTHELIYASGTDLQWAIRPSAERPAAPLEARRSAADT
jgi:hypothetical protein